MHNTRSRKSHARLKRLCDIRSCLEVVPGNPPVKKMGSGPVWRLWSENPQLWIDEVKAGMVEVAARRAARKVGLGILRRRLGADVKGETTPLVSSPDLAPPFRLPRPIVLKPVIQPSSDQNVAAWKGKLKKDNEERKKERETVPESREVVEVRVAGPSRPLPRAMDLVEVNRWKSQVRNTVQAQASGSDLRSQQEVGPKKTTTLWGPDGPLIINAVFQGTDPKARKKWEQNQIRNALKAAQTTAPKKKKK